jgi:hypothetical protein
MLSLGGLKEEEEGRRRNHDLLSKSGPTMTANGLLYR